MEITDKIYILKKKKLMYGPYTFEAIKENYVSISPIKLDMTSYDDLKNLENWLNN